jgi:urate oxidase/2-oxo-4-hydroxy-4-carboxy-5-ureidoimidazoline decarboxylase
MSAGQAEACPTLQGCGGEVNRFASGEKRSYYGKGDVIVYRLHREEGKVFGANVLMLLYGDAFWPTYTAGDNSRLVATDSMKNFIQRETLNFLGFELEGYVLFLADKFMRTYPHTEGIQVTATEIPYSGSVAFVPGGPDRAMARVEMRRDGEELSVVEARSGITELKLLRLGGSAFHGFIRDQYTTLPDIRNRPLHMWLDLEWVGEKAESATVRRIVHQVFTSFESGSIQQVIYQMGTKILAEVESISEIQLEANNRTWDTVVEQGDELGVYTDARPPYGCLGLTLRR